MQAPKFWQQKMGVAQLLKPLSALYRWGAKRDKEKNLRTQQRLPRPVVIVGNINVGGTGKTPVTIALIEALQSRGYSVGLISRGYGRTSQGIIVSGDGNSNASVMGDEPYLIHQKTGVPVAVGGKRYDIGLALLSQYPEIDIIVSDDGLQHYALYRDFEIAVIGEQGIGNGYILPAGPLREGVERLQRVDAILSIKHFDFLANVRARCYSIQQSLGKPYRLTTLHQPHESKEWCEFTEVSAVAGIAHPDNFFCALHAKGVKIVSYPFNDHHEFSDNDFIMMNEPIFMTEKDAVKCIKILDHRDVWVVPLKTVLPSDFIQLLITTIYKKADD